MSLSATVTFNYGGNTVTLPSPKPGYDIEHDRIQTRQRTAGGQVYIYDKAVTHRTARLTFELTATQKAAFISWYDNHAVGSTNTFTYTDMKGNAYTGCRLMDVPKFAKSKGAIWSLTLEIDTSSSDLV